MRTIAYTALAYGSCYLPWAIRSIIDHVQEYYVLYSADGSHGHKSTLPLPESESRDNLYRLAKLVAGDKLRWIDGDWTQEGQQRDSIHEIVPDADVVLVLDYDEIWSAASIERTMLAARYEQARHYRVPMIHYWRSFHRAILHDPAYPIRMILPKVRSGEQVIDVGFINHMGYAIPSDLMAYKRGIHGHKAQFRTDVDWWTERWLVNAQQDCHPVGSEYWNPDQVNPLDYMPGFMQAHPFFNCEVIE